MSERTVPTYALPSSLAIAREIVDSDVVLRVFAACEWDELHDDGKLWVSAIVEEARRRMPEPPAPSFSFSGNVRPAPFAFIPPVIERVLTGSPLGTGLVAVPLSPVKLVDQARGGAAASPSEGNQPVPLTIVQDGGEEPERVAPPEASLSAPVEFIPPSAPTGAEPFGTNDTPGTPSVAAAVPDASPKHSPLSNRTARKVRALPEMPTDVRRRRLEGAIAHLKRLGILVSVCDRDALVRQYRVTGKRDRFLADEVVAYAIKRGFEAENG